MVRQLVLAVSVLLLCSLSLKGQNRPANPASLDELVLTVIAPDGESSVALREIFTKHRQVILNFVSARCPYSRRQIEGIRKALNAQSDGKASEKVSAPVLIVFVDKSLAKIRQAIQVKRLPAQVVWDKGGKLFDRLKVKTTPTVAVVAEGGRQVAVYEGFFPPDPNEYSKFFARLLKAVAQGSPLPPRPVQLPSVVSSSGGSSCTPAG
ncbi:redoxin domain-containing protein [Fervidibacter sacchari]|uniref:Thioredoxin-related protein n=1 Tax=Candidatus Fervidibacter sacchari TaxID=1448929 RepID=A0ABT2ERB3_9BACT|nr:redoxin domain-containing protein [Candidatus Fervidibacter sacchari]MCS3920504.1 thioredoxin-related protein [Candidatus Fervidibacter sacchari]WKU14543.1 redoxin domain-containing protein [Candidatus Fervidibacter sacchari]